MSIMNHNDHRSRIKVRLTDIHNEAKEIKIYSFSPLTNTPLPAISAGAHINIFLPNGLERKYSLLHANDKPSLYKIGVKRDPQSRGGSSYIHENFTVGSIIEISHPINHFMLNEEAAHSVLIAGGIGITPLFCMMERLESLHKNWELHYSCRSREDALFLQKFANDDRIHLYFDDEREGRFLPLKEIIRACPQTSHFYCCGPTPMLADFEKILSDYPREQIHFEYFSAKEESALEGEYKVHLSHSGIEVKVLPGSSILHTLLENGINVPYCCEEGICGECEVTVIDGIPDHRDSYLTSKEQASNKTMLICCSGSKGSRLILDL